MQSRAETANIKTADSLSKQPTSPGGAMNRQRRFVDNLNGERLNLDQYPKEVKVIERLVPKSYEKSLEDQDYADDMIVDAIKAKLALLESL